MGSGSLAQAGRHALMTLHPQKRATNVDGSQVQTLE